MIVNTLEVPATKGWGGVFICVALFVLFLCIADAIYKKFSKGSIIYKNWPFYLSAVVGLILLLAFGATIATVKGMILTLLFLYASLSDLTSREVPDCISVMILILAFVGFEPSNLLSMLLGAAVVFVPQIATILLAPEHPIGGADIKISTALAFLLGAGKGVLTLIIGMLLAIVITAISNKINDRDQKQAFPLVPFLWIGATLMYMI